LEVNAILLYFIRHNQTLHAFLKTIPAEPEGCPSCYSRSFTIGKTTSTFYRLFGNLKIRPIMIAYSVTADVYLRQLVEIGY